MRISQAIESVTANDLSNFQTKRNYISMSHAVEKPDILLKQYYEGFPDSLDIRLKCYKGYQWEKDLMMRLLLACTDQVEYDPEKDFEITAFGGLVKGHVEATFEGYPCDCKTVPLDEHLPTEGVSKRIYWQLNAYMLYMKKEKALVIYESRETGHLRDFWIRANPFVQEQIDEKFQFVTNQILSHAR